MAKTSKTVNTKDQKSSALLQKYKEEPNKLTSQQKDKLIMEYAPLIKFIAQKISMRLPSNIELDDLIPTQNTFHCYLIKTHSLSVYMIFYNFILRTNSFLYITFCYFRFIKYLNHPTS